MMIPPIVAQAAPARDTATPPADGFEQAMAAALGVVPPQAQTTHAPTDETAAVVPASGIDLLIAPGPGDGTQAASTPGYPVYGNPGGALGTVGSGGGVGSAGSLQGGNSDLTQVAATAVDGESPATTTDDSSNAATGQPVSGTETPGPAVALTGVPDGHGSSRVAEMTAGMTAVSSVAPNQTSVPPTADPATIAAQALGLRTYRGAAPVTGVTTEVGTGTTTAAETGGATIGDTLALDRSADQANTDAPTSGASAGDTPVVPTSLGRPSDHSAAMAENALPATDIAAEAGLPVGSERPARPQDSGRQPAQPPAPILDAVAGGGDQVATQPLLPGGEVDGGTQVPSGMLQRIEDAVRRLENAPPPRSITLSIDDQGLTRVTVSMLSDGVRLTVPEGSQTPTGLVQDLEQALSSRGFELSRDGEQQKRHRPDDDDLPFGAPPAPLRRTTADTGVRI
jgi:hypothetical protein